PNDLPADESRAADYQHSHRKNLRSLLSPSADPRRIGLDDPLRLLELADHADRAVLGRLLEQLVDARVAAALHRVARGLRIPARDREQDARVADPPMQPRAARARRALQDAAHAHPRV